jgi:hypothetical protein
MKSKKDWQFIACRSFFNIKCQSGKNCYIIILKFLREKRCDI